jgi:hypothetical protein
VVDLRHLRDLRRFLLMMRDRMMRVGHAYLRVRHAAELAAQHEGHDAREIGLIGEHLEIAHQLDVIVVGRRNAGRMIDHGERRAVLLLGPLDAAFDVANRVEILDQLRAIALTERALQMPDLLAHGIEHAAILTKPREARFRIGAAAVAEEAARTPCADCFRSAAASPRQATRWCWCRRTAKPTSHAPAVSPDSTDSSSEASCVDAPISFAAI